MNQHFEAIERLDRLGTKDCKQKIIYSLKNTVNYMDWRYYGRRTFILTILTTGFLFISCLTNRSYIGIIGGGCMSCVIVLDAVQHFLHLRSWKPSNVDDKFFLMKFGWRNGHSVDSAPFYAIYVLTVLQIILDFGVFSPLRFLRNSLWPSYTPDGDLSLGIQFFSIISQVSDGMALRIPLEAFTSIALAVYALLAIIVIYFHMSWSHRYMLSVDRVASTVAPEFPDMKYKELLDQVRQFSRPASVPWIYRYIWIGPILFDFLMFPVFATCSLIYTCKGENNFAFRSLKCWSPEISSLSLIAYPVSVLFLVTGCYFIMHAVNELHSSFVFDQKFLMIRVLIKFLIAMSTIVGTTENSFIGTILTIFLAIWMLYFNNTMQPHRSSSTTLNNLRSSILCGSIFSGCLVLSLLAGDYLLDGKVKLGDEAAIASLENHSLICMYLFLFGFPASLFIGFGLNSTQALSASLPSWKYINCMSVANSSIQLVYDRYKQLNLSPGKSHILTAVVHWNYSHVLSEYNDEILALKHSRIALESVYLSEGCNSLLVAAFLNRLAIASMKRELSRSGKCIANAIMVLINLVSKDSKLDAVSSGAIELETGTNGEVKAQEIEETSRRLKWRKSMQEVSSLAAVTTNISNDKLIGLCKQLIEVPVSQAMQDDLFDARTSEFGEILPKLSWVAMSCKILCSASSYFLHLATSSNDPEMFQLALDCVVYARRAGEKSPYFHKEDKPFVLLCHALCLHFCKPSEVDDLLAQACNGIATIDINSLNLQDFCIFHLKRPLLKMFRQLIDGKYVFTPTCCGPKSPDAEVVAKFHLLVEDCVNKLFDKSAAEIVITDEVLISPPVMRSETPLIDRSLSDQTSKHRNLVVRETINPVKKKIKAWNQHCMFIEKMSAALANRNSNDEFDVLRQIDFVVSSRTVNLDFERDNACLHVYQQEDESSSIRQIVPKDHSTSIVRYLMSERYLPLSRLPMDLSRALFYIAQNLSLKNPKAGPDNSEVIDDLSLSRVKAVILRILGETLPPGFRAEDVVKLHRPAFFEYWSVRSTPSGVIKSRLEFDGSSVFGCPVEDELISEMEASSPDCVELIGQEFLQVFLLTDPTASPLEIGRVSVDIHVRRNLSNSDGWINTSENVQLSYFGEISNVIGIDRQKQAISNYEDGKMALLQQNDVNGDNSEELWQEQLRAQEDQRLLDQQQSEQLRLQAEQQVLELKRAKDEENRRQEQLRVQAEQQRLELKRAKDEENRRQEQLRVQAEQQGIELKRVKDEENRRQEQQRLELKRAKDEEDRRQEQLRVQAEQQRLELKRVKDEEDRLQQARYLSEQAELERLAEEQRSISAAQAPVVTDFDEDDIKIVLLDQIADHFALTNKSAEEALLECDHIIRQAAQAWGKSYEEMKETVISLYISDA